jgi:enoyl-CoA hydratase
VIELDDVDGVALVRLSHGKVNALDLELVAAIADRFTELATSPHRAVVFTGTGSSFSAGVDLWRVLAGDAGYLEAFIPALVRAFRAVFAVPKPVVAAVNGHAIAGGCVLVCACDLRLMAAGSGRIGVSELRAGVPFPAAALEILRYAVGPARLNRLVLSGRTVTAAEAAAVGLVDEVVPPDELVDRACAAARELADTIPPDTFALTKRRLRREANERIDRLAPGDDPGATELWLRRVGDGWIREYMQRITRA